jgi:hypothetical protein
MIADNDGGAQVPKVSFRSVACATDRTQVLCEESPMAPVKSIVKLLCSSCGRTGVAKITPGIIGPTASTPDGFFLRLGPDNAMQIGCSKCRAIAYEIE